MSSSKSNIYRANFVSKGTSNISTVFKSGPTVTGKDGKSAYEIWIEQGNTGTEEDFLDSLKGSTPVKGIDYFTEAEKDEMVDEAITEMKEAGYIYADPTGGEESETPPLVDADTLGGILAEDYATKEYVESLNVGGSGEWQKKTIELTEDVRTIEFDLPQAKRVLIVDQIRLNNADGTANSSLKPQVILFTNNKNTAYTNYNGPRTAGFDFHILEVEKIGVFTKCVQDDPSGIWHPNSTSPLKINGWQYTISDTLDYINSIKIQINSTELLFKAESKWEIWYK